MPPLCELTHWGRVTHVCVSKFSILSSDNGLSPGRRQSTIWTNAGLLLIGPLGTNFNEILINIHTFSSKKMHLKWSSRKWRPFCLGLNVWNDQPPFLIEWFSKRWCCFTTADVINFLYHLCVHTLHPCNTSDSIIDSFEANWVYFMTYLCSLFL